MHKRGLCRHAVSVCPSVRLSISVSVTFVDHVKTNKHVVEIFSPSGSHTIFPNQTGCWYFDGNPRNGGVECRWGRQKSRFWVYLALVRAVNATASQVLPTESLVEHGQRTASCDTSLVVSGGVHCERRRRKCLWQEASMLHQRLQNSAFNRTQW